LQSRIPAERVPIELADFFERSVHIEEDTDSLLQEAVRLSSLHTITPYDAIYVALAEVMTYELVTADHELYRRMAIFAPYARWLGDVLIS
jgi:predicted nucleic acid-binding protein